MSDENIKKGIKYTIYLTTGDVEVLIRSSHKSCDQFHVSELINTGNYDPEQEDQETSSYFTILNHCGLR